LSTDLQSQSRAQDATLADRQEVPEGAEEERPEAEAGQGEEEQEQETVPLIQRVERGQRGWHGPHQSGSTDKYVNLHFFFFFFIN
jgi:hypothetical protein